MRCASPSVTVRKSELGPMFSPRLDMILWRLFLKIDTIGTLENPYPLQMITILSLFIYIYNNRQKPKLNNYVFVQSDREQAMPRCHLSLVGMWDVSQWSSDTCSSKTILTSLIKIIQFSAFQMIFAITFLTCPRLSRQVAQILRSGPFCSSKSVSFRL